jgi:putative phage-type endonuclease
MKRKIKLHKIPIYSRDWYDFRLNGVGSSEIGCMMGLSPYKLALTLFLEKIGYQNQWEEGNEATYWGKHMEDLIAQTWEKTDPLEPASYVKNDNDGVIVRKCKNSYGYLTNPDYPSLFSSPDRIINKGQFRMDTGEINDDEGILEIKTANIFAMKKWEASVPPTYIMQVQQQLLVSELDYGEIAIFDNMRNLNIYPIVKDNKACDYMLAQLEDFWTRVEEGKNFMVEYNHYKANGDYDKMEEVFAEIDNIAPHPADGQEELYKEYLNERFKAEPIEIQGDMDMSAKILDIKLYDELMKELKKRKESLNNEIREELGHADTMVFDNFKGRVTWKPGKNGTRTLRVTGPKPEKNEIEYLLNNLTTISN